MKSYVMNHQPIMHTPRISKTIENCSIEFDDQINKTQYYAQIPLEGTLEDDMALDILKIRPTDVTHIDLIDQFFYQMLECLDYPHYSII